MHIFDWLCMIVEGLSEPLGVRNVDDMVSILLNIMTENPGLNQSILNTAKDIVARLDYANLPSWRFFFIV